MNKFAITLMLLFLLVPICTMAQQKAYVHDSRFPFILVTSDTATALPAFADSEFYETSTGVIFKANRTEINEQDPFIRQYRNEVLPYINNSRLQLRKVFIRGAASPEGSFANNQRLGRGRSQALLDELSSGLMHQYVRIDTEISSITEDYGYLCLLMKQAGDADAPLVCQIFEECRGDEQCCKQRLQAAKGGKLWSRLLREYFPQLRAARLILWFSLPDEAHAPLLPFPKMKEWQSSYRYRATDMDTPALLPTDTLKAVRRHMIAVRTNLLHDFFYMPRFGWAPTPNIQLEYYPKDGHLTYNIGMSWSTIRHWDTHEFWQMRDFQFELRRYFRGGGRFLGAYLGAVAEGNVYGVGLGKKDGWEGEGGALSLSAGYVLPLNRRKNLRMEFMVAAGYYLTRHDPYVYGNPVTGKEDGKYYYDFLGSATKFKKRNHRMSWIGPTNVGLQLTYDIIYRKRNTTY